jgi:sortase A
VYVWRTERRRIAIKKRLPTIILALVFLVGAGLLLYPTVSDLWNSYRQSLLVAAYTDQVEELDEEDYEAILADAETYNESLVGTTTPHDLSDEEAELYNSLLDITGNGIMGYIEIDKIDCSLPIYHTTEEEVMQIGAGHMEGTSLPIGGENTHSVICAHRGLPSARLFTDLDQMEEGDTFVIHVLNETVTYEVDQILVVDPDDSSALAIEEGKDLCTLYTCTPYGVNTHRLLVRGHRVPNAAESVETEDAAAVKPIMVSLVIAIVSLIFVAIVIAAMFIRRKKR